MFQDQYFMCNFLKYSKFQYFSNIKFRLSHIFFVFIGINNCECQINNCKTFDSLACFQIKSYATKQIFIKKIEYNYYFNSLTNFVKIVDVDSDCIPEFIIPDSTGKAILILDSRTGLLKKKIITPQIETIYSSMVTADVDGDNIPEFFIKIPSYEPNFNFRDRLMCYNLNGSLKWMSDIKLNYSNNKHTDTGSLGLTDFNQDGHPELYINNQIFNAITGVKIADGGLNGVGCENSIDFFPHPISVAGQLDDDTTDLELAAGFTIYKVIITNNNGLVGNSMIPFNIQVENKYRDGFTSIADINFDGILDVVVTSPGITNEGIVYIYSLINGTPQLLANAFPPNTKSNIGGVYVGKIQSNDIPYLIFSRYLELLAYTYDGSQTLKLKWILNTTDSSGCTGLTLFDLNNDGIQEIIYRDETELKLIDGTLSIPNVIAKINCFSDTWNEYPIVGDIDNSGQAMICIPCAKSIKSGYGNLTIFSPPDSLPGWAPARGIWNQYAYNPLFINDDLTVPQYPKNPATYKNGKYNNFYQQESLVDENGMYKVRAANLSGDIHCINYDPVKKEYTVIFDIYNRENASLSADSNLAVSLYDGNPLTSGNMIGTYHTLQKLERGDTLFNVNYTFTYNILNDLFIVINTQKNGGGVWNDSSYLQLECDYTDNLIHAMNVPQLDTITKSICQGSAYDFYGTLVDAPGIYYHTVHSMQNCDSIVYTLELKTIDTSHTSQSITTCDQYIWNNMTYDTSGNYALHALNAGGCDSTHILNLIIHHASQFSFQQTACNSYTFQGGELDSTGIYTYQLVNAQGCDSILTLDLIIHSSDSITLTQEACNQYSWNGVTYTQSGTYTLDTVNRYGCDSVVTLQLNITPLQNVSFTHIACDSFAWNGKTYLQSGIYNDTITNGSGCDTVINLALTIHHSMKNDISQQACDSIEFNGEILKASGQYTYHLQTGNGCDSLVTLNLQIQSEQHQQSIKSCEPFIWSINQNIYDQSGIYSEKFTNQQGCDSIEILDLKILGQYSMDEFAEACHEYFWQGGDTLLSTSGTYQQVFKTIDGCDSVLHLDLMIHAPFAKTDTIVTDSSYVWNINQQVYDSSGLYEAKYTTTFGCDSVHQLFLTIIKSGDIYIPNSISINGVNNGFTFFDNGYTIESIIALSIYDRWGELVWKKEHFPPNEPELGWNGMFRGKPVIPSVFAWTAQIGLKDGTVITKKGDLMVFR